MPARQKRAPDFITDGCEQPRGCWELNSRRLEKQPMLLTTDLVLQLLLLDFLKKWFSRGK